MSSNAPYYRPARESTYPTRSTTENNVFARDTTDPNLEPAADHGSLYSTLARAIGGGSHAQGSVAGEPLQQRAQQQAIDGTLLEAVTTAAGKENALEQMRNASDDRVHGRTSDMDRQQKTAEEAVSLLTPAQGRGKRKRASSGQHESRRQPGVDPLGDEIQAQEAEMQRSGSPKKRRRQNTEPDPITPNTATSQTAHSTEALQETPAEEEEEYQEGETTFLINEYPPAISMTDARAAGVYSAAALFRKPSNASKKYTRPPMSKLFTSLELTPETFLRLQASAKAYMLDPAHPERQATVGNRGKGESDMVKLKLLETVKEFLERDDNGTRFFGEGSEGAELRPFSWPRNADKVVSLVTPLLRRMVTNERQRQYAVETRKAGGGGGGSHAGTPTTVKRHDEVEAGAGVNGTSTSPQPQSTVVDDDAMQVDPSLDSHVSDPRSKSLTLRFAIVTNPPEQTLLSTFDRSASQCADHAALLRVAAEASPLPRQQASTAPEKEKEKEKEKRATSTKARKKQQQQQQKQVAPPEPTISALSPSKGLVPVVKEAEWTAVLEEVRDCVWMEGWLRVVVHVPATAGGSRGGRLDGDEGVDAAGGGEDVGG